MDKEDQLERIQILNSIGHNVVVIFTPNGEEIYIHTGFIEPQENIPVLSLDGKNITSYLPIFTKYPKIEELRRDISNKLESLPSVHRVYHQDIQWIKYDLFAH